MAEPAPRPAPSPQRSPQPGVTGDPHLTLFVARLNLQTTEEKLKEVFSRYGDIRKIRLVRDLVTGFSKGYAFIEYKEERALLKAHRDANRLVIDQHEIFPINLPNVKNDFYGEGSAEKRNF
uniref:RRM domain-containing protein n=1 Tax=Anas zonorhyncha TaxID=75864 RepID=A0A8B9V1E3_9AVES